MFATNYGLHEYPKRLTTKRMVLERSISTI